MLFILEDHLKYKNNQTFNLSLAEQTLKNKEKSKQTLASFLSKQKLIKVDKNIKTYQSDVEELKKNHKNTFLKLPQNHVLPHLCQQIICQLFWYWQL